MKSIRIHKGDLQVASHRFYNPMTGRHFALIGVCHVSDGYFWDQLQRDIEAMQRLLVRAEVHYEGVLADHLTEKPEPDDTFTQFSEALGLVYQRDGLTYHPHWIRTDLTMKQVLAKLAKPEEFLDKQAKLKTALRDMTDYANDDPAVGTWIRRAMRYILPFHHTLNRKSNEYSVLIDQRNRHAVSTMVATGTDIITLWGAEHLKGMSNILINCGYEHTRTYWNTCVPRQLPNR